MPPTGNLNPRYVAILAASSILILVVGSMLRPAKGTPGPVQAPSEAELARLAWISQRRSLETTVGFFATIAGQVEGSTAWLPDEQVTGIAWTPDVIVTARLAYRFPDAMRIAWAAGEGTTKTVLISPDLPVAGLQASDAAQLAPVRRVSAPPQSGAWVVTVWRTDANTRAFAASTIATALNRACGDVRVDEFALTPAPTSGMEGAGVFDVDGNLVAMVLPCGDRLAAVAAGSIDDMIGREGTPAGRFLGRFGLRVGPLTAEEGRYFEQPEGLIVREVWNGYAAGIAGLHPGDLVTEVNGSSEVNEDACYRMASADTPVLLKVRRGRATVSVTMSASAVAPPPSADAGLTLEDQPVGFRIDAVSPESAAAAAGIQAGDRLLWVDHTAPRTVDQVRRLLRGSGSGRAAFVEIERGGRRWGVLLS